MQSDCITVTGAKYGTNKACFNLCIITHLPCFCSDIPCQTYMLINEVVHRLAMRILLHVRGSMGVIDMFPIPVQSLISMEIP